MNFVPQKKYEWQQTIREVVMPPTTKLVALLLSTYANSDGTKVHPGRKRLARECKVSVRTIERQLAWLETHGLLLMTYNGALAGRRGKASEYRLGIVEDLPERVAFVDASPDTGDEGSTPELPTPVTDDPAEPPTPVTGTTDTETGTTDTRDVEPPTPVTPHLISDQNNHQSSGHPQPLREAFATAGLSLGNNKVDVDAETNP